MKLIHLRDIQRLQSTPKGSLRISAYIPYFAPATELNKEAIITKNILKDLQLKLEAHSPASPRSKAILQRFSEVFASIPSHRHDGALVLFDNGSKLQAYHAPFDAQPQIHVGTEYVIIDPLREAIEDERFFYLLTLSQKKIRLFRGSNLAIKSMVIDSHQDIRPMLEELRIDEVQKGLQNHPIGEGSRPGSEGFHGHGTFKDVRKQLIAQYFRGIDKLVSKKIKDSSRPVILAGVDYLLPIYQKITRLSNPVIPGPRGNFDHASSEALLTQALPALQTR